MTQRSSGVVPPPEASSPLADPLRGRLGAANLQDRAIGVGAIAHLKPAGKLNAVYSVVNLTNLDQNNVDVPHSLGQIPAWCLLVELNGAVGSLAVGSASPVKKDQWTVTNCRMAVRFHVGGMAGTQAVFMVAGG
jgi:hypothetical protein